MDTSNDLSITFLGCGTLGTAILSGVLSSLDQIISGASPPSGHPSRLPSVFTACVQRPESAERIHKILSEIPLGDRVSVIPSDNVAGVQNADIVLLGCKPYMCYGLLTAPGMREALHGKLLISICAGVTISQLLEMVSQGCRVIRAMPNTAARVARSPLFLLFYYRTKWKRK
jgi:pyrroline-5-carboxylate reductase